MQNLSETQIKQANLLIEKYGFCSLETQRILQENGFFEKVDISHSILYPEKEDSYNKMYVYIEDGQDNNRGKFSDCHYFDLPMPQFHEIWAALPNEIVNKGVILYKTLGAYTVYYENPTDDTPKEGDGSTAFVGISIDFNICDAACLLWLKLKQKNLLTNG